ncbi:hypothetical protein ACB092_03G143400 [Castanea dentata]
MGYSCDYQKNLKMLSTNMGSLKLKIILKIRPKMLLMMMKKRRI